MLSDVILVVLWHVNIEGREKVIHGLTDCKARRVAYDCHLNLSKHWRFNFSD